MAIIGTIWQRRQDPVDSEIQIGLQKFENGDVKIPYEIGVEDEVTVDLGGIEKNHIAWSINIREPVPDSNGFRKLRPYTEFLAEGVRTVTVSPINRGVYENNGITVFEVNSRTSDKPDYYLRQVNK